MDTEKKANKPLFVGIGLIVAISLILSIWSATGWSTANAEEATESNSDYSASSDLENYESPTPIWKEEGYNSLPEWWEALQEKQAEYVGKADEVITTYADYLSEEQQTQLRDLENELVNATSFANIAGFENQFNEIVNMAMTAEAEAEAAREAEEQAAIAAQSITVKNYSSSSSGYYNTGNYSGSYYDFLRDGVVYSNGNKYTYYSQSVLPGGGLNIPGRHVDGGFVKDSDGYIVVASDKPMGTVGDSPFGATKTYDRGTTGNHYDIYVE